MLNAVRRQSTHEDNPSVIHAGGHDAGRQKGYMLDRYDVREDAFYRQRELEVYKGAIHTAGTKKIVDLGHVWGKFDVFFGDFNAIVVKFCEMVPVNLDALVPDILKVLGYGSIVKYLHRQTLDRALNLKADVLALLSLDIVVAYDWVFSLALS
ncbi:hypothetical protein MRX96_057077 [Rhipicephalus microplus]